MDFDTLFEGLAVRHATDSARDTARHHIEKVLTSPETGGENALFVVTKTALFNGRYAMASAYARGCRLFLCAGDAYVGKDATVMICEEPERLLGTLAARVYGHPSRQMTVFGITGSAGKSSVAQMTAQTLRQVGRRVGVLGTDGLELDGISTPAPTIVPDAAAIQRDLRKMADNGIEFAILELSSYQLAHHAAEGIAFTAVLLTNLLPRHVGRLEHPDFAAYRAAKQTLMQSPCALAVLPVGEEMETRAKRVLRLGEGGDCWAENVHTSRGFDQAPRTLLRLFEKEGNIEITLPVLGDMAVQNTLCAATLCRAAGLSQSLVARGLANACVRGRMECIGAKDGRLVYRDAAFCAEDLSHALHTLRSLVTGRLCVLLGSVGGRAKERRASLARAACECADFVYFTADDPDGEDPAAICGEMLSAMAEPARAAILTDRRLAISRAVREMREGDVLLILAKPTDTGQLVRGSYQPFAERDEVAGALALI